MLAVLAVARLVPVAAVATNGDNLIWVGPISRAMGGVGIAAPRDAMCCGDYCPNSKVDSVV